MPIHLNKLVSVMLPTWRRPDRVCDTISSIVNTCSDVSRLEIVLRVQQDDPISIRRIPDYLALAPDGTFKVIVGQKHGGYAGLHAYYEEIAALCVGSHVWTMNDDVTIEGHGWDRCITEGRYIFIPEKHGLGCSTYLSDGACPFMIYPNGAWKEFMVDHFVGPFDRWMWEGLRRVGHVDVFMAGVKAQHSRNVDSELNQYRSMSSEEYVQKYIAGDIPKEKQ